MKGSRLKAIRKVSNALRNASIRAQQQGSPYKVYVSSTWSVFDISGSVVWCLTSDYVIVKTCQNVQRVFKSRGNAM